MNQERFKAAVDAAKNGKPIPEEPVKSPERRVTRLSVEEENIVVDDELTELGIVVDSDGKTQYSKARPRRKEKKKPKIDPLTLFKCLPYENEQPFKIVASPRALVSMDFHAHLLHVEIIGFLAGQWDSATKSNLVS